MLEPPQTPCHWPGHVDAANASRSAPLTSASPDKATADRNEAMGLALAAEDVAALEGPTERWIAALRPASSRFSGVPIGRITT